MTTPKQGKKKAAGSLILALILAAMLVAPLWRCFLHGTSLDGNTFQMGRAKIELNDGQTIFHETSLVGQPGYSVVEDFTVENTGTAERLPALSGECKRFAEGYPGFIYMMETS